jgi:hypothetical protein
VRAPNNRLGNELFDFFGEFDWLFVVYEMAGIFDKDGVGIEFFSGFLNGFN